VDERFRAALGRNALLSDVLSEGADAAAEGALRARLSAELARTRRRRALSRGAAAVAAVVLAALVWPRRAPEPAPAPSAPSARRPVMVVVRTRDARPSFETVRTPAGMSLEIVRTGRRKTALDLARDEELLSSPGVVAIVGHPGAPKRLVVDP